MLRFAGTVWWVACDCDGTLATLNPQHHKHTARAVSVGQGMLSCDGQATMKTSWLGLAVINL